MDSLFGKALVVEDGELHLQGAERIVDALWPVQHDQGHYVRYSLEQLPLLRYAGII